jgi:hypothetical protein
VLAAQKASSRQIDPRAEVLSSSRATAQVIQSHRLSQLLRSHEELLELQSTGAAAIQRNQLLVPELVQPRAFFYHSMKHMHASWKDGRSVKKSGASPFKPALGRPAPRQPRASPAPQREG